MKDLLKKYDSSESFKTRLAKALFHYRSVPHNITQVAPSVALNSRKLISKKDRVNPNYFHSQETKVRSKQIVQFEVGDTVLELNAKENPKWYKGTVVERIGINIYMNNIHKLNVTWKRHANQLAIICSRKRNRNPQPLSSQRKLLDRQQCCPGEKVAE